MRIKTKVTIGVAFLFGVTLAIGALGLFYLNKISGEADNILKNNYESLEHMKSILDACETIDENPSALDSIGINIQKQEKNITEPGEQEYSARLRNAFDKLSADTLGRFGHLRIIRKEALAIQELNMKAIVRKNEITQKTAARASTFLIAIGSIFALIAFTFIVNFPGYIANPITQLTYSIKAIANKDYEERLQFSRKDEFEELANAFNRMAEKLDEYEHSNLANLLFEKKRIETIINRMHDPLIGLDENRKILFVNTEALELLSVTEEKLIGKYAPDVAVSNDLLRKLIQGIWDPEETKSEGLLKIYADGKESYFSREIIPISHTPTGEVEPLPIGNVILLRNITPFKEHDLAKTNFIATISHELKTPIASLQMGVRLLRDDRIGELNQEQQRLVQTVSDEASRLAKITGELLDLAQVETGNIKLNLQLVDPSEIIENAFEAVKFQADQQHIVVEKNLDKELPTIRVDKDKTTWVLINFLTNAIRHSPQNGQIIIRANKENGHIQFSVKDFGMGIDPRYKDKLFDRFYQVPGAITRKGTGLGLSISKEFIEAQGGTIAVDSELGQGSTFKFSFVV
jgi:two-component system, NtrC family, sensor histidine kinase KinB